MAELEESRRKVTTLRMQKDGGTGMHVPIPVPVIVPDIVNGSMSPEKPADRSKRLRELKESIEEIKVSIFVINYHSARSQTFVSIGSYCKYDLGTG